MKIWEIWFAKFPFEEDPSIEKERDRKSVV